MKKSLFLLVFTLLSYFTNAQYLGTAQKVYNVPVFIYSYPTANYEEVGELGATFSAIAKGTGTSVKVSTVVKELVDKAKTKRKKGKVGDFDAIIVSPDDMTGILIKFDSTKNLTAQVERVLNVPVYVYCEPQKEYEEVGDVSLIIAISSDVAGQVKELIQKAKRLKAKGKVGDFDAMILDVDDMTGVLIKFK